MFAEDLSAFFNQADFASVVVFGGESASAIFDNGYATANVGSAGMASSQPMLTLPGASVPPRVIDTYHRWCFEPLDAVDLEITVDGAPYRIVGIEPDGTGITRLLLERMA